MILVFFHEKVRPLKDGGKKSRTCQADAYSLIDRQAAELISAAFCSIKEVFSF